MSSCEELSPQGRAFSTILTAFIGSIINGLTSGYLVAFITGWISWFATLRILSGALISLYQSFSSKYAQIPTAPPTDEAIALEERGLIQDPSSGDANTGASGLIFGSKKSLQAMNKRLKREVTVLGWIGWVYTAIYSPIIQVLWFVDNVSAASGPLKLVRGLGISITALGLTIDTKKRYALKLQDVNYIGGPACVAFKLINAGSAFAMGCMCAALLVKGALDMKLKWYFIAIYCVFCVIWTAASLRIVPVQDGGIKGLGIIRDVLMGAFAGVFLAAPAFIVMRDAEFPSLTDHGFSTPASGQASLNSYLSCESVAVWRKMAAVLP